ncbi:hypothetical protein CTAYLR_002865 [Chrysophaeum taylorii]|uniref:Protein kinase domain-containing protein n=1 Tax=Chrysophaeum taylorii TaxID=2483200 RepID=A0AAD7XG18_9STRA|nr:hypothetical protein CTAYLR_002865 [Chrysophaeum taylorii]
MKVPVDLEMPTSSGEYVIDRKLGTGSYATVWLASRGDQVVALKAISRDRLNAKLAENLESEMRILREFAHPNLVGLVEISKHPQYIYIALEYMRGGDLQKFIRREGRLGEGTARRFMGHLASGLEFLWSKNLIHRDLKPQNLLLTEASTTATLKIADFGFARRLETAALAETLCGSPLYMAPEILSFKRYDAKADLWSVGAILFEMLVGSPPFAGRDHRELLANIKTTTLRLPADVRVSQACLVLLQQLLKRDPVSRISLDDFVACEFCRGDDDDRSRPRSGSRRRRDDALRSAAIREDDEADTDDDDEIPRIPASRRQVISSRGTTSSSSSSAGTATSLATTPRPAAAAAAAAPPVRERQLTTSRREEAPPNTTSSGEFVVVDHGTRRRRRQSRLAVEYADEALGCALTLGWVGDGVADKPVEALAVYVQAIRVAQSAFKAARAAAYSGGDRQRALLALVRDQHDVLLARADDARTAVRSPATLGGSWKTATRATRPVPALVYEAAMNAARTGAARESLGDTESAANKYAQASRCLAALLFSFDLSDTDRAAILAISRGPVDRALERVALSRPHSS